MPRKKVANGAELRKALGHLDDEACLVDEETAAIIGCGVPRLRNRRTVGDAPISAKVGRDHLTRVSDLRTWLARKRAPARRHA